jgi:hemerythrin superfamily protein
MATREPSESTAHPVAMLKADHRKVEALFRELDEAKGDRKADIAETIARELTVHATLEEQLFYPAVAAVADDELRDLVLEAVLEHGSLKMLLGNLEDLDEDDDLFDPTLKVLKEYVQHHVREEEQEMMPKAERAGVDWEALGEEMASLKAALQGDGFDRAGSRGRDASQAEARA